MECLQLYRRGLAFVGVLLLALPAAAEALAQQRPKI
jgi:hypothetical protein